MIKSRCLFSFLLALTASACRPLPSTIRKASPVEGNYLEKRTVSSYDSASKSWSATEVSDILVLKKRENGNLDFCFELRFDNGHQCEMEGSAKPVDDHFDYIDSAHGDKSEPCHLEIQISSDTISLHDADNSCRPYNCGARGIIDGATFKRSSRSSDSVNCGVSH